MVQTDAGNVYDVAREHAAAERCPWTNPDDYCGEWAAASDDDWEPAPDTKAA